MKQLIRNNAIFLLLSLILLGVLGLALLCIPKGELHLLLCNHHTPARDIFYRYYTQIAEWFPYVVCVALLLFSRIGDGILASSAMLLSALFTQVVKHIVVAPRPLTWFGEQMPHIQLPLVEGVDVHAWYSFPSGHTTSFFSLAFVLSIVAIAKLTKSNKSTKLTNYIIQFLLFIAAALGGYSRIYLSQHFALDVFAGILVGVGIPLICYAVLHHFEHQKWYNYQVFTKK